MFYSLARPELLDLLAATGSAVALCPNYGTDGADEPVLGTEVAR